MNDAPREIWAYGLYEYSMGENGEWDTGTVDGKAVCHDEWPHDLYIRKSALTLADCLAVPEVRTMVRLLTEVFPIMIEDCEATIRAEFGWPNVHPAQQQKFDDLMAEAAQFRAALRKKEMGER